MAYCVWFVFMTLPLVSRGISLDSCREGCRRRQQHMSSCIAACTYTETTAQIVEGPPSTASGSECGGDDSGVVVKTAWCGYAKVFRLDCPEKVYKCSRNPWQQADEIQSFTGRFQVFPLRNFTFQFSWETARNGYKLDQPAVIRIWIGGELEYCMVVNGSQCDLSVGDGNGIIKWQFNTRYRVIAQVLSTNQSSTLFTQTVVSTCKKCPLPMKHRQALPAPHHIAVSLDFKHGNTMNVRVTWEQSVSAIPVEMSTVAVTLVGSFMPSKRVQVTRNTTSAIVTALDTSKSYNIDVTASGLDHFNTSQEFCFLYKNQGVQECEYHPSSEHPPSTLSEHSPSTLSEHPTSDSNSQPTEAISQSNHGNDLYLAWMVGAPVGGTILLILALFTLWRACRKQERPDEDDMERPICPPEPSGIRHLDNCVRNQDDCDPPQVLVVYSEAIADAGRQLVYTLRQDLKMDATSKDFDGHRIYPNIVEWTSSKVEEADFIILMFDEDLALDWRERRSEVTSMIFVHVEGLYTHDQRKASRKCIVVVTSQGDERYVPPLMGRQKYFLWKGDGRDDDQQLLHTLLRQPQYEPPPVTGIRRCNPGQCVIS